jgi:MFS family permease
MVYMLTPSVRDDKLTILLVSSLVLAFGIVCFCTAFMNNFAQFMVIRILLGIAEGGMMPGIAYYLSTWYKRDELALRMGIFGEARDTKCIAYRSDIHPSVCC